MLTWAARPGGLPEGVAESLSNVDPTAALIATAVFLIAFPFAVLAAARIMKDK